MEISPQPIANGKPMPTWLRYIVTFAIVTPVVEFVVVVALVFWRILFGVYTQDLQLFAEIINTFGSSFVNSVAFGAGAGGVFGLIKSLPKLLVKNQTPPEPPPPAY
jgi:hypothetical protein